MNNAIKPSLTQFVDYTLRKSVSSKLTKVKEIKNGQGNYAFYKDFYGPLRNAIINIHERSIDPQLTLDNLLNDEIAKKSNKVDSYRDKIKNYRKFYRKFENATWIKPSESHWNNGVLSIRTTPELGLVKDLETYYIKLYFNNYKGTIRENIDPILRMMYDSERVFPVDKKTKFCLLNLNNGQLYEMKKPTNTQRIVLKVEANQFIDLWNSI